MGERADGNAPGRPRGLPPGATIGVFGSGQLGRMLALEAARLGYRVTAFSDDIVSDDTPAGQVSSNEVRAAYDDETAVRDFAARIDVATTEFENVPAATLDMVVDAGVPARPSPAVLHIAQHRRLEKQFFASIGVPTVAFASEFDEIGPPAIAKTTTLGYDGKGQWRIETAADLDAVRSDVELLYERRIELASECSVIAARNPGGDVVTYPAIENHHTNGILDWSVLPARLAVDVTDVATAATRRIIEALDYVGVLCVEFFVTSDGAVLANEFAPRPHNSGHLTIEACATSQFEQQARAVCDLPLGSTAVVAPTAMANLLGDLWARGEPAWAAALALDDVHLHLYGKSEPRPGRKMGHLSATARTADEALELVLEARHRLTNVPWSTHTPTQAPSQPANQRRDRSEDQQ